LTRLTRRGGPENGSGASSDGNGNGNGNGTRLTLQLVFWILGAMLTVIGSMTAITHQMMMHQLDGIEHRIERIEDQQRAKIVQRRMDQ